jgi:glycyl-tRNA synthetase
MVQPKENPVMERVASLCKRRGFIYQSSEIYGGIGGFWDYGPLGTELKRQIRERWWRAMVRMRDDVVGLEASIIMHPRIWKASGHVDTFADLMRECPLTKKRVRADQVDPQSGTAYFFAGAQSSAMASEEVRRLSDAFRTHPDRCVHEGLVERASRVIDELARRLDERQQVIEFAEQARNLGFSEESNEMLRALSKELSAEGVYVPFTVLLPEGKSVEVAFAKARQFYEQRGVQHPAPIPLMRERVVDSTDYHPESGVLMSEARPFNLMFQTHVGPLADEENVAYLRPETAQAIFAQFKTVLETSRQRLPFGIAQIGKAFRNEVTPRNYIFRSREFEQMELEYFIRPDEVIEAIHGNVATPAGPGHPGEPRPDWGWQIWHQYWVEERVRFYESIGLPRASLEEYWQKPEELAHYARATVDILFKFPFGTQELEGIAARSDFDLSQHQRFSGKPMGVFDDELRNAWARLDEAARQRLWQHYHDARLKYLTQSGESPESAAHMAREDADGLARGNYIPHVIEPSAGVDRMVLALLTQGYAEDQVPDEKGQLETRVVLRLHPAIAPVKVAVFPLLKNKPALVQKALEIRERLRPHFTVAYDDAGAIGRRYRRQDEAGTPFGITIDFETLGEKGPALKDTVTLRDRDTCAQERVSIGELIQRLHERLH